MGKQFTKKQKLEVVKYLQGHTIAQTISKFDISFTSIQRWKKDFSKGTDNLEWGRCSQTKSNAKKRITGKEFDNNKISKMSRTNLEEIAKLHLALKKYEAKTTKERFFAVNELSTDYSVDFLCKKLEVSR